MSLLITGHSGNVGRAALDYLQQQGVEPVIGVRSPQKYQSDGKEVRHLDLEDETTFLPALEGVKGLFLVRPPQLSDVQGIFQPFIQACVQAGVEQIVFLSLLGVEKNPFPPHHKIEKMIEASGLAYTFLRPSFFMQNLIEPHGEQIREEDDLFIPCGKAKVSFIDTQDIGEIAGRCLVEERHRNKKYTLTGPEAIDYYEVAKVMSRVLGRQIHYSHPGFFRFRKRMITQGTPKAFANVMSVLYLTTRLGMAREVNSTTQDLLGRPPHDLETFVKAHQAIWQKSHIS